MIHFLVPQDFQQTAVADAPRWPANFRSAAMETELLSLGAMPTFAPPGRARSAKAGSDQSDDDDEAGRDSPRNAAVAARLAEHAANTLTPAGFVNLGKAKQKEADLNWWKVGLHQILLYICTSRQGQGSRTLAKERAWVRKGKGKGK